MTHSSIPQSAPPPIVVIGSINTDFVHRVPRLPAPGETVTAAGFDVLPGGKGANQAVAAARLGARVSMVRRLGVPTVLDPAPVPPRGLPRALFAADFLTPNQPEALQLTGKRPPRGARLSDPKGVAARLLARGARTTVLKLGARGAAIATRD